MTGRHETARNMQQSPMLAICSAQGLGESLGCPKVDVFRTSPPHGCQSPCFGVSRLHFIYLRIISSQNNRSAQRTQPRDGAHYTAELWSCFAAPTALRSGRCKL